MQTEIINKIFETLQKNNPTPSTELEYKNEFTLLISVVLSAQATDKSVNKVTNKLFEHFDTPEKIIELGEEGLKNFIRTIGLYNSKAKNILALCHQLITKYQGKVPTTFKELIILPGIGRKTANVMLNCLFNHPVIAVDTHVFRVAKRLGLSSGNSAAAVEKELMQKITKKWLQFAHHWLVLHGRYICVARKPKCMKCELRSYCNYYHNINVR